MKKIDKNNVENILSLTKLQEGMLFHYIDDETSKQYYEQLSLKIKGDIKLDLLQKAWNIVIENNEMLRTVFRWKGIEKPIQIVLKNHQVLIKFIDFTKDTDIYKSMNDIKTQDLNDRIDITEETLRIYLCKLDESTHEMIISNHHILYDGWSNGIILKEVMEIYSYLYDGKEYKRVNKTKFSQFIKYLSSINKEEEKKYWSNYLKELDDKDNYFSCKEIGDYRELSYRLDESKVSKLKDFLKENKLLLSSLLYGVWAVLLQKFSDSKEVLFGTTVSGRPETINSVDKVVGLFINTVPIRVKFDEKTTIIELINYLGKNLNERKGFENTSLTDIREHCELKANEHLFDSIVAIENYPLDFDVNKKNILSVEEFFIIDQTNYNMTLKILTFDGIEFKFNFNSLSIDISAASKLGVYMEKIIETLINKPNTLIRDIELLSNEERDRILYEFNDTDTDYPIEKTIHKLFEEQVEKTPDKIAVMFEKEKLTYKELNERANSLAVVLRRKGVKADSIVGIMVERSIEMIVGIMGILKSGGAYLPIDPVYPKSRIEYMLKDAEAKILVCGENNKGNIADEFEEININDKEILKEDNINLVKINESKDLAYVIYTSGSTGKPKGVMVEHRQVNNFINGIIKETSLNRYESILNITTICFDMVGTEIFVPLTNGMKVIVANNEEQMDGDKLGKLIEKSGVEVLQSTPSRINVLMENDQFKETIEKVKLVLVGAEEVKENVVEKIRINNKIEIYNAYGPTETTVWSTVKKLDKNENITIGRPINNTQVYIMKENSVMPIGMAGELCIAGDGVTRGYLGRQELTDEKFVSNPFKLGTKMYKTGDIARWLEDGSIEYIGRKDNQVKIRGYRIETGEIENKILKNKEIKAVAVVAIENEEKEKQLCAYVVAEKEVNINSIKSELKEELPEYMIPTYIMQIEKMPLTSNGKLDKRNLPKPEIKSQEEYEVPRNETEEKLVEIWKEVLGINKIGINDNFFDIGGHSLKAIVVMSKISKEIGKEIKVRDIFKYSTIKELSEKIEKEEIKKYEEIEKAEEKEYYEASSAQKRMYMLHEFNKESIAYNIPAIFEIEGKVDEEKIETTIQKLIERHEALRTKFETIEGEIVQKIEKRCEFKIERKNTEQEAEEIIKEFIKPFDLEKAPLIRAEIAENKEKIYLMIDMPHIISDGISMNILIKDFKEIYEGKEIEELKLQYKDFSEWQNRYLKSEEMKKQEEYWTGIYKEEIPLLEMPTDYERPIVQSFEGGVEEFEIEEELTRKVRELAKETGTTIHIIMMSVLNILMSKYSGQEDIVIGTPVAGRQNEEIEKVMGMFVNTLAIRNKPDGNKRYIDFLEEVKENCINAYENQSYQLEELIEKLEIRRDMGRNPLFDVMISTDNILNSKDIELKNVKLKLCNDKNNISKFDLTLSIIEDKNKLQFVMEYCSKLFKIGTIKRLCDSYLKILHNIVDDIGVRLSEIDLLSSVEKNKILYEFNNTKIEYPYNKTIHELFEEQVKNTPDSIAVVFEDSKLTYKELNEKSNSLASVLRENGVKADSIVAIIVERSLEMMIGILGILKAGGAYLPIDPDYPNSRIEYILNDSGCTAIVTDKNDLNDYYNVINIKYLKYEKKENLEIINSYNDLAYIIYTSGSTGTPKGVMIEHRSVVNIVTWFIRMYDINSNSNIINLTDYTFDASIEEIFVSIVSGSKLYIPSKDCILDINEMRKYIVENEISTIGAVPSLGKKIIYDIDKISVLDRILLGGEKLSDYDKDYIIGKGYRLYNHYGPTETTVDASLCICNINEKITIGKPVGNTQVYILNNRQIMPIGVIGELYIAGDGLARGYLNRKELTDEKFVNNPFKLGTKMYKTGDMAKWLEDGNIEYIGRKDNQVKIRGYRIETGEIENKILKNEEIKEVSVVATENEEKEKQLCAYVVSEKEVNINSIKTKLKEEVPEYMIPTYIMQIEKMPLLANGKLDKRNLPKPEIRSQEEYEAPRNEAEEKLVEIWKDVLGINKIGINDNFFDIGGHSLKAIVLVSKIGKEIGKEIKVRDIFKYPTIKELSEKIEKEEVKKYEEIEKAEEKEYYEASSAQKRMYMLHEFNRESTAYNMPAIFEIKGKADGAKIERTIQKLIERHEALRTRFETKEGEIVQKIEKRYEFKLVRKKTEKETEEVIKEFVKPFDLGKAPLIRAEIAQNKEKKYLMIDMPHIISDGISTNILIKDFKEIYEGTEIEELKLQYKDFSEWQNRYLKSEEVKKQEEYWTGIYKEEIPVLEMPTDYERPIIQSFEGEVEEFEIEEELTRKVRELAKETGTTIHMIMMSVLNILLSKYSGQEDIVIGTPVVGRQNEEIEKVIGIFVNTLAIRNKPEGNKRYIDFLEEVKENCINAYENQSYQLEELIEKLEIRRDMGRNPLFDVMLNIADTIDELKDKEKIELSDINIKSCKNKDITSKFDITLNVAEQDEKLIFSIEYSIKLFKKETIRRMKGHYKKLLESIVENKTVNIKEIEILTEEERQKLLYEFNDTAADYPREKTIHQLFEEQVEKTPDKVAVMFEEEKLTYKELNERANSLAVVLREKDVKADSIVGIMVERSIEMIVGIMGILKAGGAYLPIDPTYPKSRIEYMLKDAEVKLLIRDEKNKWNITVECEKININDEEISKKDKKNLEKINEKKDLAYVIYTSGSTGKPKGVMVEHRQVNNFINGIIKETSLNRYEGVLNITTICFDIFGLETLVPLTCGMKVIVANNEEQIDGSKLGELIEKSGVEVIQSTPARINILMENDKFKEKMKKIRLALIGGEEVKESIVEKIRTSSETEIYNVYGPTETTIWSTVKKLNKNENITIGRPINNTQVYIIKENNVMPIGMMGELCIAGDGITRGYLGREELTSEKFVDNPFELGKKMYKTGDIARWLEDGNIEYIGRKDNQVKIRGYRIEIGEIESKILKNKEIKEAVVVTTENEGKEKQLCAYIVSEKEVNINSIKAGLKEELPEYMIPTYIIQIEKMPLTANEKLDKRNLPKPEMRSQEEYEAPRNETEEKLVKIWKEVLGINKIGINDNFFDTGGHSLKAIVVMSKISKETGKEIKVRDIFKYPTIKELSEKIEKEEIKKYEEIEKAEEKEYYEASSAQKRMYMLHEFNKESTAYNIPAIFEIKGKVDEVKIERTIQKLIERHEALRTRFETIEGEIVQKIEKRCEFKIEMKKIEKETEEIIKEFIKPFDLEKAPLIRAEIAENKERIYLMIDMPHIISDGISMNILIKDFKEIYEGKELEELKLQYKDFSEWQNRYLKSEEVKKQEEYWTGIYKEKIPVLEMPTDYERPIIQSFEGEVEEFEIEEELTRKVRELAKETGTTIHMIMMSVLNILLSKYSGQEDIVIGTPVVGRQNEEIEKIIGIFVNTLAIRNKPEGNKRYIDFLEEVKENCINAYENQSYQLEELIEKLEIRRDMGRNPLFDVMINSTIMYYDRNDIIIDDVVFNPYSYRINPSKVDIELVVVEKMEIINFLLVYSTAIYDKITIEMMVRDYLNVLTEVINYKELNINDIGQNEIEQFLDLDENLLMF